MCCARAIVTRTRYIDKVLAVMVRLFGLLNLVQQILLIDSAPRVDWRLALLRPYHRRHLFLRSNALVFYGG